MLGAAGPEGTVGSPRSVRDPFGAGRDNPAMSALEISESGLGAPPARPGIRVAARLVVATLAALVAISGRIHDWQDRTRLSDAAMEAYHARWAIKNGLSKEPFEAERDARTIAEYQGVWWCVLGARVVTALSFAVMAFLVAAPLPPGSLSGAEEEPVRGTSLAVGALAVVLFGVSCALPSVGEYDIGMGFSGLEPHIGIAVIVWGAFFIASGMVWLLPPWTANLMAAAALVAIVRRRFRLGAQLGLAAFLLGLTAPVMLMFDDPPESAARTLLGYHVWLASLGVLAAGASWGGPFRRDDARRSGPDREGPHVPGGDGAWGRRR